MKYKTTKPSYDLNINKTIQNYDVTFNSDKDRYLTFLYVDDNSIDTWLAVKILETTKIAGRIITASNGVDGLKALREYYIKKACLPHVIIIDIQMPIMDGFEMLKEIYKHSGYSSRKTKLIFITEGLDETDKRLIEESNINHVILKPLDKEDILSIINSY